MVVYKMTKKILTDNKDMLTKVAKILLEKDFSINSIKVSDIVAISENLLRENK